MRSALSARFAAASWSSTSVRANRSSTRDSRMSTNGLRTADGWWAVRGEHAVPVRAMAATTAEPIADRAAVREAAASGEPGAPVVDLVALSPVTTPCRAVAQTVNYRSLARDSLLTGDIPPAFFRKASGSVIVHGRSGSTVNRNGVRLGSADIHDDVERLPEIAGALSRAPR